MAQRYNLPVKLVANSWMRIPNDADIELVVVKDDPDAADDWIVENAGPADIVVSDDIPLAARVLKKGARALNAKGRIHTEASIGETLATRDILSQLRDQGQITSGPAPLQQRHRSQFLQSLDQIIQSIQRNRA